MTLRNLFISSLVSLLAVFYITSTAYAHETTPEHAEKHRIEGIMVRISQILEMVASLQAQIAEMNNGGDVYYTHFSANMRVGDENADVKRLQLFLNSDARTTIASFGPGSPGNESNYFGSLTKAAVIRFQELYRGEILTPNGLVRGNGYVGPSTRAKMNLLSDNTKEEVGDGGDDEEEGRGEDEEDEDDEEEEEEEEEDEDEDEDEGGSGSGSGTTPDTTPPEVSDISVNSVYETSATILWSTNEPADTQVEYGLTTSYGDESSLIISLATSHNVSLSGLESGSTYNYRVISADEDGNTTTSPNKTFSTEAAIDPFILQVADPDNYSLTRIPTIGNVYISDGSHPLAMTLDDDGNPWVVGEFQVNIINIDKEANFANLYRLPEAGPIFGWINNSSVGMSNTAEDMATDNSGNVWSTQGGAYVVFTGEHNHSRIISVNTATKEITAYNVVENNSTANGIMYDEEIDKIYFLEAGIYNNEPKLVSFTPGSIDTSIGFDNQAGLDALNCVDANDRNNCYFVEDIPWRGPSLLVKGLDGNIYFTGSYDNYLGQYNPQTRGFKRFTLPEPRGTGVSDLDTSFPWDIEVDKATGDILLTEYIDTQIVRFQTNKESSNECQIEKVSEDGSTEHRGSTEDEDCIIEYNTRPAGHTGGTTHSLEIDDLGNIWFTTDNYLGVIPVGGTEANYRKIEGLTIPEGSTLSDHMAGLQVDNNSGDVWVNSYSSQTVFRLERDF